MAPPSTAARAKVPVTPPLATRMRSFSGAPLTPGPHTESRAWLLELRAEGGRDEDARRRLHELLLRAARFEIGRRRGALPHLRGDWSRFAEPGGSPASRPESHEVMGSIRNTLQSDLSRHQREVLIAVAVNGVPIDVLAERLNTSRLALCKTIHDARKKLRAHLADTGLRFVSEPEMAEPR
jgi:DNA-directed RNA polymerase specialized sigma24 family protein